MKKKWVYPRVGPVRELTEGETIELRNHDRMDRLAVEGTQAERVMEGFRIWERDHGLNGLQYPVKVVKKIWADDKEK